MEKYRIIEAIGDGSFGEVFKAVSSQKEIVAIKKMKEKYGSLEECYNEKEIKCLKKLAHPNLIRLKEVILASNELFLVFDYMEANLYQVYLRAKESNRTLTESEIRHYFFKIAAGLAELHRNGFFHRDLKPENILCFNNQIKICDFGMAREIRSRPPFTEYVATRWYRAPELLLHGQYNSPVDIFALGCIMVELYLARPLFPGATELDTMNLVVEFLGTPKKQDWPEGFKMASTINYNFPDCKKKELSDLIPQASPEAIDLLESMLSYSSRRRPSAAEILKHDFFNSINYGSPEEGRCDEKNETKFSFYEKNVIEIPKNVSKLHNKEMDMRKSQIKFGNSFTSSFHLTKDRLTDSKPVQSEEKHHHKRPTEKRLGQKEEDAITKKFDEMERILLELQFKQEKDERTREREDRQEEDRRQQEIHYEPEEPASQKYVKKSEPKREKELQQSPGENSIPVFSFGGMGINSFSSLQQMKNKTPSKPLNPRFPFD